MDQQEFRKAKESGGLVDDAGLQTAETTIIDDRDQPEPETEEPEELEQQEEFEIEQPEEEEDDLPPLNEKEKTAFEKRMERERAKLQEKLEAELSQKYEQQYGKHKQVLESLGGDPDVILQRIQDNKIIADANRLADSEGWSDEQYNHYIQQQRGKLEEQRRDKELQELRVQIQINRLRDNPEYTGIGSMEKEILTKIEQSRGALTVDEAYWALGGSRKAEQIRLEAQVREAAKRGQKPRTVLTDSPTSTVTEKPLPPEILRDAERMGISPAEARRLMSKEPAQNIDEFRKRKAK